MTDAEAVELYDKARLKCMAVLQLMEEEGITLEKAVYRYEKLGRKARTTVRWAFQVTKPCEVNKVMIDQYLRKNRKNTEPPVGVVDAWCDKCIFINRDGQKSCHYYILTGRRRGCPAGKGCTRRILKRKEAG